MSHFINSKLRKLGRVIDRYRLIDPSFTLFSNDCWGAEVYKHLNLPYNTPFVGLMLMAPCYLKLLSNPHYYLAQSLVFQDQSRYSSVNELQSRWKHRFPIATLGEDIEIQFLHYETEAEALEKWTRRIQRINWSKLFVKFDGSKDFATSELVHKFDKLPFSRLTLLRELINGVESAIVIPKYTTDGKAQFELSLASIDLVSWLNGGSFRPSLQSRIYNTVFFSA